MLKLRNHLRWTSALAVGLFTSLSLQAGIRLELIGDYQSGIFDESAAEINAYDPLTEQLFVVNANNGLVDVLDLSDPTNPVFVQTLEMGVENAAEVNSVAVRDGILAVAVAADPSQDPGSAVFFATDDLASGPVNAITVGSLPDMIIFTPDGTKVLTANEGEPDDDYLVDPLGSVSIIDISGGIASATVTTVDWSALDAETERAKGVRIFGPNATVGQDLEPEYIAVSPDSQTAFVAMQENNALGIVDLATGTAGPLVPLGTKDHSLPGNGFDASDRDDVINITTWPTLGLYLPDAIKIFEIDGTPYIFSANEGDTRDYDGYSEETEVGDVILDPTAFPNAAALQENELLGRLLITNTLGDDDGDGDYDRLFSIGGRSFSIWDLSGNLVWDSGDQFEQVLADLKPLHFNSNNDENGSKDSRSDAKGPEPEAVEVALIGDTPYAFIGLERMGGIMVYDVSDPTAPVFIGYETSRDFSVEDVAGNPAAAMELGPEDITFIPAADSPNDADLLVVTSEVSGSVTIYEIVPRETYTLTLLHVNDPESQLVHAGSLQDDPAEAPADGFGGPDGQFLNFGGAPRFLTRLQALRSEAETDAVLTISAGDNFLPGLELGASDPDSNPANTLGIHYDALTIAAADFDVSAIGNHEFDLGPDYLLDWYTQLRTGETVSGDFIYPVSDAAIISANLDASALPALDAFIVPSTVIEKSGERIGIIGGTTWLLPDISSPGEVTMIDANSDGSTDINDLAQLVQAEVDAMEAEGINKIILVTHLQSIRFEQDLVRLLSGVDVVVGGGGNELLANEGDPVIAGRVPFGTYPLLDDADGNAALDLDGVNVPVVVTDGDYRYIGRLVLEFDDEGNLLSFSGSPERVSAFTADVSFEGSTITNDGSAPDPFLEAAVQAPVFAHASSQFLTVLAESEVTLESRRAEEDPAIGLAVGKRVRETNLGNLTADAVLYEGALQAGYLGVPVPDIGFQNGGGIRNDGVFAPGPLSLGDVFNFLPFTNFNSIVEGITPATLKEILEHSVSRLPDADGQFLQISGFSYIYDPSAQAQQTDNGTVTVPGERILEVVLDDGTVLIADGEALAGAPTLTAATNSFVATGGDGYYWLEGLPRTDAPSLYGDALINFVRDGLNGTISEDLYGPETVGFRIQTELEANLDFLDGLGTDAVRTSSWMGRISIARLDENWIQHPEAGFLNYWPGGSAAGMFLYSDALASWTWTNQSLFPILYDYGSGDYVIVVVLGIESPEQLAVYNYTTGEWTITNLSD